MNKIFLAFVVFSISYCELVAQDLLAKLEKEACDCIDSITSNSTGEELLSEYHKNCITHLMEENIEKLSKKYGSKQDNPNYLDGYKDAQRISSLLTSELIISCENYYHCIDEITPNVLTFNTPSLYKTGEIDSLTKYINLNIRLFSNYCQRAVAYIRIQEFENAFSDLDAAVGINPSDPTPYIFKGFINYNQKNFKEAADNFKIANELNASDKINILYSLSIRKKNAKN